MGGLQELFFGDLKLCIGPARNLNNHVQDGLLLIGIERNVVEGRDGDAILLNICSEFVGVQRAHLTRLVLRWFSVRHGG
jgi:hypothetical protein